LLAAFRMVDRKQLVFHLRSTKYDAGVVIATALAALVISVEFCIVIGVFLSFVLYVPRAAQSRMTQFTHTSDHRIRERQPGDPACDRLRIFGLDGELFFGAEPELASHLATIERSAQGEVRAVVLVLKQARNPDAAFLHLLRDFHSRLCRVNATLLLCGVHSDLRKALASTGIDSQIGVSRILCESATHDSSIREAVEMAYSLLGANLCATCPRRNGKLRAEEPLPLEYEI
jgi:SulP family sulfate permease